MNFKEYFKDTGVTIAAFARKSGLTIATLRRILNGKDTRISTAFKIERTSNGKVTVYDLIEEYRKNLSREKSSK